MRYASSKEVRRNVTVTLAMAAILAFGVFRGIKEVNQFRAYQDSLSPSEQSQYIGLSLLEQIKLFNAAQKLGLSPSALEFYLNESARPGSPLANMPLADALQFSSLVDQTGQGALLIDYVARYGYTDALRMAPPEVIKGMTSDQFLVQAQKMLSQDTGYNVSPESWFKLFPEIGRDGTYITNKAAIAEIIGEFEGKGTIKISQADAEALAVALGLDPKSFKGGFRISRIVDINDMDLSYPVTGNDYFLGPGTGLPGGGPELKIDPSLPMDSPNIIEQVIIEVVP